ncbi:hypothetical protein V9K67_25820 [Paraflavisolibacter sp. H34]|uniref:hypothetical protein n=1 Tax=Huijunlia imazamoxiresistens TaxID=3127457 RepID=UPI003019C1E5
MSFHLNEPRFIEFNYDGVQICAEFTFNRDDQPPANLTSEKSVWLQIQFTGVTSDPIVFKVSKPYSLILEPKETVYSVVKKEIMKLHSNKNVQVHDTFY